MHDGRLLKLGLPDASRSCDLPVHRHNGVAEPRRVGDECLGYLDVVNSSDALEQLRVPWRYRTPDRGTRLRQAV
jgi:hypothetical protein